MAPTVMLARLLETDRIRSRKSARGQAAAISATLAKAAFTLLGVTLGRYAVAQDYVKSIEFSQQTSTAKWADTHDVFTLQIRRGDWNNSSYCNVPFPFPQVSERQKGSAETYHLLVDSFAPGCEQLSAAELALNRVSVVTQGTDMWLPAWISVSTTTEAGHEISVVSGKWPSTLWFSRNAGTSNGRETRQQWSLQQVIPVTYAVAPTTVVSLTEECAPCSAAQLAAARQTTNMSLGIRGRDVLGAHIGLVWSIDGGAKSQPILPDKQTFCGELKAFRYNSGDKDWLLNIYPSPFYIDLFNWARARGFAGESGSKTGCPTTTVGCVHAEISPVVTFPNGDFFSVQSGSDVGQTRSVGSGVFCVYGPWVGDQGHAPTDTVQEIHPTELIWWQEPELSLRADQRALGAQQIRMHHLMMLQDASMRYENPTSFPCTNGVSPFMPGFVNLGGCPRPWATSPRQSEYRMVLEVRADGANRHHYLVNNRYSSSVITPQADQDFHTNAIEFNGVRILSVSSLQRGYYPSVAFDSLCYEAAHFELVKTKPRGKLTRFLVPARVHGQLVLSSEYGFDQGSGWSGFEGYEVLDVTREDYGPNSLPTDASILRLATWPLVSSKRLTYTRPRQNDDGSVSHSSGLVERRDPPFH